MTCSTNIISLSNSELEGLHTMLMPFAMGCTHAMMHFAHIQNGDANRILLLITENPV